ncbi:50S ribosomal protein L33 [Silvanigrella paludirubra]|uniref:Large ribosomal subunit protein bL33 n=1 Tax=Silvanigrella paludirubra TaxID=2499159 RepID=A0A6N6VX88_9BACT|nr:50S ribosomal protein L33 [Silvanigrella paludirubra]KAB8038077.1 50S ribosomal protein L33 [Silvanigrella paludirubra]
MRDIIKLICSGDGKISCSGNNLYSTTKNKKASTKKLELKKYCKYCRKHTLHRESK